MVPRLVRISDVAFTSWDRFPGRQLPRVPWPDLAPDLAIAVRGKSNRRQEMDRKLRDCFTAGIRLVWYVHSESRTVSVFTSPGQSMVLGEGDTLGGGQVLPGFELPLRDLLADPGLRE